MTYAACQLDGLCHGLCRGPVLVLASPLGADSRGGHGHNSVRACVLQGPQSILGVSLHHQQAANHEMRVPWYEVWCARQA